MLCELLKSILITEPVRLSQKAYKGRALLRPARKAYIASETSYMDLKGWRGKVRER